MKWWWRIRLLLELLCTFHPFGVIRCQDADTVHNHFNFMEIVYPEAVYVKKYGNNPPRKIIFFIPTKNRTFRVDIKQQRNLQPLNLRVYKNKNVMTFKKGDFSQCSYNGKLKGIKHSAAMLNTCHGLHGVFEGNTDTYYIEPWEYRTDFISNLQIIKFPHRLYNMSQINHKNCSLQCKYNTGLFSDLKSSLKRTKKRTRLKRGTALSQHLDEKSRKLSEQKYLQLYLVNDYSMYLHYGKNETFLEHRSRRIANILNVRFKPLNLKVVLVGVEVWTTGDRIKVTSDAPETLRQFMAYRERNINPKQRNDNAQLITRLSFTDGTSGEALTGVICSRKYSAAISQDPDDNPLYVSTVLGHQIGHNLGMYHDTLRNCTCPEHPEGRCIMSQSLDPSVKNFSACSIEEFKKTLIESDAQCLFDVPTEPEHLPVCGNNITEKGEECDCGSLQECIDANSCCDSKTCKYFAKATCISGPCCEKCQLKPVGAVCRNATSECDLPEFCSGTSTECSSDVYLQNGQSCRNGNGSCYDGACLTHDDQCKTLYGINTTKADDHCYESINTKGNENGHCGKERDIFKECNESNALCGKLQCSIRITLSNQSRTKLASKDQPKEAMECDSVLSAKDGSVRETRLELVLTGTKCGHNKICFQQECVSKYSLDIRDCPSNCSGHGVCNSKNHCHCDNGWAPPLCDRPGIGGSIDSGQHQRSTKKGAPNSGKGKDEDIGKPLEALITMGSVTLGLCFVVFLYKMIKFLASSVKGQQKITKRRLKGPLRELLDQSHP